MEIDLELITAYSMTADEYILFELIRRRHYNKIRSYFTNRDHFKTCLDRLVLLGFIELIQYGMVMAPQDYKILKIPAYNTKIIDDMFEELLENYPKHVIRPNGVKEYLRTNTPKTKELYKQITKGSKDKHDLILECLRYQLAHFARMGKMPYMRKMINWLANQEWEEFKEYVLENDHMDEDDTSLAYGQDIL